MYLLADLQDKRMSEFTLMTMSCGPASTMFEYLPEINGTKRYGIVVSVMLAIFQGFGLDTADIGLVHEHDISTNVEPAVPGPGRQPLLNALYQGDVHFLTNGFSLKTSRFLEPGPLASSGSYVYGADKKT